MHKRMARHTHTPPHMDVFKVYSLWHDDARQARGRPCRGLEDQRDQVGLSRCGVVWCGVGVVWVCGVVWV